MDLKSRAEELLKAPIRQFRVLTDTTEFLDLNRGDVLELAGRFYVLKGMEREGRFGLDDQPKHWVRTALDLYTGEPRILKLVFHEEFDMPIGPVIFRCARSPSKEARILKLVEKHPGFMQGISCTDSAGNQVRIIERVNGSRFDYHLDQLQMDHREYFQKHLKAQLYRFMAAMASIGWLHRHRQKHGDIRRDHLYIENTSGKPVWIDFDYNFFSAESPYGLDLFGLGNVLAFVVGKGQPTIHWLKNNRPELLDDIEEGDCSLIFKSRVFNLKKIYPYLPEKLNRVLMHFAVSTPVFYESAWEMIDDLKAALPELPEGEALP